MFIVRLYFQEDTVEIVKEGDSIRENTIQCCSIYFIAK